MVGESAKLALLLGLLQAIKAKGERVLVFSQSLATLSLIQRLLQKLNQEGQGKGVEVRGRVRVGVRVRVRVGVGVGVGVGIRVGVGVGVGSGLGLGLG